MKEGLSNILVLIWFLSIAGMIGGIVLHALSRKSYRYVEKKKLSKRILITCVVAFVLSFIGVGITAPKKEVQTTVEEEVTADSTIEQNTSDDNTTDEQEALEEIERKEEASVTDLKEISQNSESISSTIPAFSGNAYVVLNGNVPTFSETDLTTNSFESYGSHDSLGRCTTAFANVGQDVMPTEKRGAIGAVKPTGWHTVKYDSVDGKYLYNRCHLIGYQLTAENANTNNLITGTRYLNVTGMLPFENMVADYVKETNHHVLYRVTPLFEGDNLVASGVIMEALSVEDDGAGVKFNVFCYNVQPGISINYATGDSSAGNPVYEEIALPTSYVQSYADGNGSISSNANPATDNHASTDRVISSSNHAGSSQNDNSTLAVNDSYAQNQAASEASSTYILNTSTKKFHKPSCNSAKKIKSSNYQEYSGARADLIKQGYSPCHNCNP